jgi:protein SCO1
MPIQRRSLVLGTLGAWAVARPLAAAQPPTGWVLPRLPAPALLVTSAEGQRLALPDALAGKVSAVQLMFTGCSSTCPIQGALFAALAERRRSGDAQFLSLSIDALGDSPATLSAWQSRFGRSAAWRAAVPKPVDVDRLAEFMKGASGRQGTHTAQVFVFDAQAKLCYRTGDNPAIGEVEALLAQVARQA